MNGLYLTKAELEQLDGSSLLAFRVYVVLRGLIDLRTGIVGRVRRISYQALAEQCEASIPRGKGFQRVQPSEKELRTALQGLERLGLIVRQGDEFLCFHLPYAYLRPKQTGRSEGTLECSASNGETRGFGHTGQAIKAKPGTHQRIRENPIATTSSISTLSSIGDVDNSAKMLAANLKEMASRLGWRLVVPQQDHTLGQWAKDGVTSDQMEKAVTEAIAARKRDQSKAPLFPAFIGLFLGEAQDWRQSWSGIEAKGHSLGLHQTTGETCPAFKARVYAAARATVEEREAA